MDSGVPARVSAEQASPPLTWVNFRRRDADQPPSG